MKKPTKNLEFQKAYKALNAEQKKAVDHVDGPVMLVAGPGTGKTQTLALRIANILQKTDTNASSILALTFTESGSRAMRARLSSLIGSEAYYANISTFHAFCIDIIKSYPDVFTLNAAAEPLSDLEKLKLIYALLDSTPLKFLRPPGAPRHYAKAILGAISDLKREGVDCDELAELLRLEELFLQGDEESELKKTEFAKRTRNLAKNKELNTLYGLYQAELTNLEAFDFEDMITTVVDAFKTNPDLLLSCQEKYLYILVDEYQDTNSAQNELILQLASYWGDKANIFVTGDPDQCLPGNTLIATENGEVPIKDIKVGDRVLSAVGKGYTSFVPVKHIFKNKRQVKLITLTLKTGQKITSTHNHKMFCFIPPREQTNYWYVYLMYKKDLGWRIGTTIGLSHRLKLEGDTDKIIGIKHCETEQEARFFEMVYSLRYQIPTVIFKHRNNMISGEWLTRLYQEFDTVKNAQKLADDLGINLNEPHYQRDGTTFGKGRTKINLYMNSRSYRTKYAKDGLLHSPGITHEINIQTKNPKVLKILHDKGFKLRNKNIGKGLRLVSQDLSSLYKIGKELEKDLDGILDIKSSLGTHAVQHKPTRIMQAGNVLIGNYLPIKVGNRIEYSQVISKTEDYKNILTYDLEVYPSHNFIANGVVVHNSIMRFQGASIENQLSFIKVYPKAIVITLRQNYRSTQTILDAADSLIAHNNLRIGDVVSGAGAHLLSQLGKDEKISLAELSSSTAETIYLAEDIKAKIDSGVSPQDIAIIYHKNIDSKIIADTLVKYGLDYRVQGGADILSDPTVRNFLKILRVIYELRNSSDDEDLFTILHYDIFGIDALDVLKISRLAGAKRLTLFEILADSGLLDSLELATRSALDSAFAKLSAWQALDAETIFIEFFEKVLNDSGYLTWVLGLPDALHRLARLNTLFDEVKRMNRSSHSLDLKGFIANLKIMEDNAIRLEESTYGVARDAITLTTAHKSKGLEWEHVYLYKAIDKNWGNNKRAEKITLPPGLLKNVKLSDKEKNEDERRLFYVALTRAKSSLTITSSRSYSSYGSSKDAIPTMFLAELEDSTLAPVDVSSIEEEAHKHLETILSSDTSVESSPAELAFLQDLADQFKLSATSLNSYLFCAYKFKLDKLLRVPHAKKAHLAFGTAVHSALEHFYSQFRETSVLPGLDYLLSEFNKALSSAVITKLDLGVYTQKGREVLTAYYAQNESSFAVPLATEKNLAVKLGSLELTGKLDRLEWSSRADKLVRVVDYKTGKSKTMGEIAGTTQNSDGDLMRQIEFYKLLIDSDPALGYKFGEAVLDFVEEPLDKGKGGERHLLVTDEAAVALKQTIKDAMGQIRALHFPRTTDLKKCEDCYFKDHCYPSGLPAR